MDREGLQLEGNVIKIKGALASDLSGLYKSFSSAGSLFYNNNLVITEHGDPL
jgi:hypothetical protein